ncbi:MAG TPA: DUF6677 family protein [Candidatus Acidoferrales bacterium]|nr:DUF6677 family protein [Candidatus Acidoferrales bacterium]
MNEPAADPSTESKPENVAVSAQASRESNPSSQAIAFALIAWILPGLGHLLLGRWKKGAAFFIVVAALILIGCAMRGEVFAPGSDGPLGTLGFFADIGSGALYFVARALELPPADLSLAAGDYGTRLIAAAGIVNILAAIDAFETAVRRRLTRCT